MKKLLPTLALILAAFMLLSLTSAFADNTETPAEADEPVDPLVGAWMMPPTPFGEDFRGFMVLNEDGSFLNATNFYDSPKCVGPFTQKVTTNETTAITTTTENSSHRWTMIPIRTASTSGVRSMPSATIPLSTSAMAPEAAWRKDRGCDCSILLNNTRPKKCITPSADWSWRGYCYDECL